MVIQRKNKGGSLTYLKLWESSCRTVPAVLKPPHIAVALLETGNHTKLWLGLPAQEVRVVRRKCSRRFCLL